MYIAGFVETLLIVGSSLPYGYGATYGFGTVVSGFNLLVCLVGAGAFAKMSFVIFLAVCIAFAAVVINFFAMGERSVSTPSANPMQLDNLTYTGFSVNTFEENLMPDFVRDYTTGEMQTIATVFGVLFNGCTGIMAGANMSGDLKNPSEAIPRGTLHSIWFTYAVYVLLFMLTAATCSRELLQQNYGFMQDINGAPAVVLLGIFAATLSAALSTLIGASRVLQALSRDNLLGDWFSYFSKELHNPIRAVCLCAVMVQLVLLIGEINTIAPIVSMFFLLCYAVTNFACFVLAVTGTPNFRPTFRWFTWHTGLGGSLSCLAAMFFINSLYAVLSVALMVGLMIAIHFRHLPVPWGDVSQALIYHQVRKCAASPSQPRSPAAPAPSPPLAGTCFGSSSSASSSGGRRS